MGCKFAHELANLYMDRFERCHILNDENTFRGSIVLYKRFLDDIFIIWKGTEEDLTAFGNYINTVYTSIKFEIKFDKKAINFLDVLVKKQGGVIHTDVYRKPTDVNSYFSGDSYHPLHLKKNLPFSQLIRLRRNCSLDSDFHQQASITLQQLAARGYSRRILKHAYFKTCNLNRSSLLTPKPKQPVEERMIVSLTFNRTYHQVKEIILKHWHILKKIPRCSPKPLFAFKRSKNLKDILVKSRLDTTPALHNTVDKKIPLGFYPSLNCTACRYAIKTNCFQNAAGDRTFYIKDYVNCNSKGIVYLIQCVKCNLKYVGISTRPVKILEHFSYIRTNKPSAPLTSHWSGSQHSLSDLRCCVIEKVKASEENLVIQLRRRETFWVHTLNSLAPHGLNSEIDWLCF